MDAAINEAINVVIDNSEVDHRETPKVRAQTNERNERTNEDTFASVAATRFNILTYCSFAFIINTKFY